MGAEDQILRELMGGAQTQRPRRLVTPARPPLVSVPTAPPSEETLRELMGAGLVSGATLASGRGDPGTLESRRMYVLDEGNTGLNQIENLIAPGIYTDEVQAYLEKKADAAREAGGDEFYQRVVMQQMDRDDLAKIAPYSRQNPPSVVGVALSGQQTVQSGGQPATVAVWAGYDEEAIAVTCAVYPILPVQATVATLGKGAWRPYASITIGLRGAKQTIAVDIGMGCQFTVAASLVQIDVAMDPVASGAALSTGATIGGHIAFRGVTRQKPITRTAYIDNIGSGLTKRVFLPLFAKDVTPYSTNAAPTLNFLDIAGNTIYSQTGTKGITLGSLANDVVAIDYVDAGGGGGDGRLVFGLEL